MTLRTPRPDWLLAAALSMTVLACDEPGTDGPQADDAVRPADAMASDRMASDRMASDRMASDGMAPDGMAPDGMAPDGMAPDGMAPDGMAPDGMASDGMASDGMASDGANADAMPADAAAPDAGDAEPAVDPDAGLDPPAGPRSVVVHLFEWRWDAIADECEAVLGPAGYRAVQVSPPQEYGLIDGNPWWERYQPVSYRLAGRSGDGAAFDDMVRRCRAAGVDILVDAVINHMAFAPGLGVDGTRFERYRYPGLYDDSHFHNCRRGIENWADRGEIQTCELATLPDLATGQPYVRAQLAAYLQDLLDRGVAGFRVDAAKHMAAADLEAIFGALDGARYVFQEVVDTHDAEVVTAEEYFGVGRVTEFRYGLELTRVFTEGQLAWLDQFGEAWGMVPSDRAVVFIDNHDTQRGHGVGDPITHRRRALYRVANVFMLAWPYGDPKVMSSYAIRDGDHGPPRDAQGQTTAAPPGDDCGDGWICEHRWPAIRAMVRFRNTTDGMPVQRWWSNGNDQIAFARGDRGYVVINREEDPTITRFFDTGLPPGRYCDVLAADCAAPIVVNADGWAEITIGPLDAVALHVDAPAR